MSGHFLEGRLRAIRDRLFGGVEADGEHVKLRPAVSVQHRVGSIRGDWGPNGLPLACWLPPRSYGLPTHCCSWVSCHGSGTSVIEKVVDAPLNPRSYLLCLSESLRSPSQLISNCDSLSSKKHCGPGGRQVNKRVDGQAQLTDGYGSPVSPVGKWMPCRGLI